MKIIKTTGIIIGVIVILLISTYLSLTLGKVETTVGDISNNPRFIGTYFLTLEDALNTPPNPDRCRNFDTYDGSCEQFTQASNFTGAGFPFICRVSMEADAPIGVFIHPTGTINVYILLLNIIIWCALFFVLWMLIKKIFFKKSIISGHQK